jgi:hypothetical protein
MKNFKYKNQINELLKAGYELPALHKPEGIDAYRFASQQNEENNHKPVSVQNPARILPDYLKTSGYALSCFNEEEKAVNRYNALKHSFKQIRMTMGDALYGGKLSNEDGLITDVDRLTGHYDLYEYEECDLNKTLTFKRALK